MTHELSTDELVRLIERVFAPRADDRALALLVDLPDAATGDRPAWETRRRLAADWWRKLDGARRHLKLDTVSLVGYRNVRRNNADLPDAAWILDGGEIPHTADEVTGPSTPFAEIFEGHSILVAPTQFSATAPLKLAARRHGFRAATMPGFGPTMVPALRLDYVEVHRRCERLKALLDPATAARLIFAVADEERLLELDLRHRTATASGGLLHTPGTAGNLPSGETYIVPYEGERADDASRSRGFLPVELDDELVIYRIEANRAVEVLGAGKVAETERREIASEPAYANLAELGLGVLADLGVRPVGEILLDEKLGLHVAFGRSDHFGGSVGAADFTAPDRVVHIDRVYLPEVQPSIRVVSVELALPGGSKPLMANGRYVEGLFA